jgi:hypothetical protein
MTKSAKKSIKTIFYAVLIGILFGAVGFVVLSENSTRQRWSQEEAELASTYTPTPSNECQPSSNPGRPYLVTISSVGIENSCVETVDMTNDGAVGDPKNTMAMGWYLYSSAPGKDGASIYTCHSGFLGETALCDSLTSLSDGAEIIVEVASGQKFNYTVRKQKNTPLERVDMEEFDSVYGGASHGLSIMTCTGEYNQVAGTATDRLMIWATPTN